MKSIFVLSLLVITVNCGLVDLLENKEQKNPDLPKKIVTDLKDDGKIVVDALTAAIKKNKDNKEDPKNNEKEEEKSEPETTEVKETTPNSPEVTTAGKTEASTAKTDEVPSTKTEEETPK